jgi:hypothetical protein
VMCRCGCPTLLLCWLYVFGEKEGARKSTTKAVGSSAKHVQIAD